LQQPDHAYQKHNDADTVHNPSHRGNFSPYTR
jgi:hypothetical protein